MKNELYHHGVLGQKWGVRRYQNPDGTLTEAGKRRYQQGNLAKNYQNRLNDLDTAMSLHRKDAVKALKRHDELLGRLNKPFSERLSEAATDSPWDKAPVTKNGIQKELDYQWKKIEIASASVDVGKAETQKILRDMIKNHMYLKSDEVVKATMVGQKYYDIVKENGTGGYRAFMDSYNYDDPIPTVDVMGNKYKVSERRKRGYRSPSEMQ